MLPRSLRTEWRALRKKTRRKKKQKTFQRSERKKPKKKEDEVEPGERKKKKTKYPKGRDNLAGLITGSRGFRRKPVQLALITHCAGNQGQ